MSITDELNKLGKEIENAKHLVSQYEGRREEILKTLDRRFQLKTTEEADKMLVTLKKEIDDLRDKIEKDFNDLKENYEW